MLLHLDLRFYLRRKPPGTIQLILESIRTTTRRCSESSSTWLLRQTQLHHAHGLLIGPLLIKEPLVVLLSLNLVHFAALIVELIAGANT